ncbi:lipoprotein-attachment site-containing protein [Luteibacter sp. UNC138MFCol5.1]|uniref:LPS translocon maturation chaperone LptM n=1 Tax=Luteibacter sp. UNC138MFCol5.1 TaxID=1502774 RepID=UPI0008B4CD4B|nr:lipoprotein [Luteibacter sp. UNC138MFCol5.1]SEO35437.1 lipoprotein-attachment site-containing protein [Luteibacter sp. UNC138MFCol5.1]
MRRLILPLALASTLAALSGCGQKGPLFMPPPPPASATAAPAAHPAASSTSLAPPPASTARTPFNSVIHQ